MPMTWTPRIDRALAVAARLHEGQYRKGDPTPYVYHPIAVALIVSDFTESEDVVVAALLHDVLEDVPPGTYSAEDMAAEFGAEVTALVQGVSEPKVAGAPKRPWQERKEGYLRRLAGEQDGCLLISAADKIHNLRSMAAVHERLGGDAWGLFNADPDAKLWFYHSVADLVAERFGDDAPVTRSLAEAVSAVDAIIGMESER